jgi:RNA polymerase sigma-70 factor (ECF subfamily)
MGIAEVIAGGFSRFKSYLSASFSQLNEYDAEDIIQQTALNLLSRGGDDIANATAYIYQALRNGAINALRRRQREMPLEEMETGQGDSAEAEALDDALDWRLEEALALLDEKSRFVFVETELYGKGYKELAEETGEPVGTLLSRKSRAVKKLSIILKRFEDE